MFFIDSRCLFLLALALAHLSIQILMIQQHFTSALSVLSLTFGSTHREYWKLHVPTIYAPDESTNFLHITYDDDSAQKLLFDTLKQFICIDNPAEVLKVRVTMVLC